MSNERNNQILDELSKPFHPSHITWRPGALTGKKDKALALAYADVRAYQNRLDEVCGMEWSVSYTPWSERIICHVTINGITRSSTGEPDSDAERAEMAGTSTEAQAFKRACAMFGLGRYLYGYMMANRLTYCVQMADWEWRELAKDIAEYAQYDYGIPASRPAVTPTLMPVEVKPAPKPVDPTPKRKPKRVEYTQVSLF